MLFRSDPEGTLPAIAGPRVCDLFLFMQWRLARLARLRAERYDHEGKTDRSLEEMRISDALDEKNAPDGMREIVVEPEVISDEMASWKANDWADNRVDLYFNLAGHFNVICKQAYLYSDVPEDYAITCPDYMVVYDSQRSTGFIVASSGVYRMTDDPENPIGEPIVED